MSKHQRRQFRSEIRAIDNGRRFEAMPLAYEVVDDYGTIWTEGVFDEAVEQRFPTLLYGHDWASVPNILGRGIDYHDTPEGPRMVFELTPFEDHPHTRQIAAQINEGTILDMSVGFDRYRWKGGWDPTDGPLDDADKLMVGPTGVEAVERMLTAGWDETSLVVRGAVPGAKVMSGVRMVQVRGVEMAQSDVLDLARRIAAGEITNDEALAYLDLVERAGADETPPPPPGEPAEITEDEVDAVLAEADTILDELEH